MSLYKRRGSPQWWVRFTHNGRRIQKSAGTADRTKAQQYHDRLKVSLWEQDRIGVKPSRSWNDAVVKWLRETSHKATHAHDAAKLRWLDKYLGGRPLGQITRDDIGRIGDIKARATSGATANRTLALIRAILRRACYEWEWIDKAPKVRMFKERKRRVRWITRVDAERLLTFLPAHQAEMVRFALCTGLRQSNVVGLEWSQIDMPRRVAWIHPDQAKARKAIAVPLNDEAVEVIRRQLGKHHIRVFTDRGGSICTVHPRAWKRALRKAGIESFRWHDLRHTWASWHVQAGTPIHELQELGGWESVEMVRRYAHLAPEHLARAAARILPLAPFGTKVATADQTRDASAS